MFLTITLILPGYVSSNSSRPSKVFERYNMSLFFSRFYKCLTKYIKLVAQKKQLSRVLEMLGKFPAFSFKSEQSVEK